MYTQEINPAGEIRNISRGPLSNQMASAKEFLEVNKAISSAEERGGNLEKALLELLPPKKYDHASILNALANC